MDAKQRSAQAALEWINDGMIVGLGGGTTIRHLVGFLKESGRQVTIVTPSYETKQHCVAAGLTVISIADVSRVDIAFDGCDQVDQRFFALKSGGGIHTAEKLIAQLADEYVLLVDESKFVAELTFDHPVSIEVLPEAIGVVQRALESCRVQSMSIRTGKEKDGPVVTDHGHYLLDVFVEPQPADQLEQYIKGLTGVVDVSLFTTVITAVMVTDGSDVKVYKK